MNFSSQITYFYVFANNIWQRHYAFGCHLALCPVSNRRLPVHCQSFNVCFMWRDISVHSGGISVKIATSSRQVSGNSWKVFHGQKSKVRGMTSPDAIMVKPSISANTFDPLYQETTGIKRKSHGRKASCVFPEALSY